MKRLLLILPFCITIQLRAQTTTLQSPRPQVIPADTVPAIIKYTENNGAVQFGSQLRMLRPIAGAPAPFYTYFWEFGDGTFSFEKEPLHLYIDSGLYKVRLFATNNYDDGKRPPTRPHPLIIKTPKKLMASAPVPNFFKLNGSITLKTNCMPKPGDDMMVILGYRNKAENMTPNLGGTVAILYNDKEFSSNNFEMTESRIYHGEVRSDFKTDAANLTAKVGGKDMKNVYYASMADGIPQEQLNEVLAKAKKPMRDELTSFKSSQAWKFEGLKAGEEHYIFLHFKTTPEMIKDTNAIVRLTGVFLPDDPKMEKEFFNVELQIVASHDPNKMSIRKTRMNYRLTGKHRELTYRIRFQNTGKGPAKKVAIGVSLSQVFDPATIAVTKTKPAVKATNNPEYAGQSYLSTVTGKDSVHFIFNNIYLPGTGQQGVTDADSTQGFVEYKIKFKEKPEKLPINTQADIVFDKNPPIYTNKATGKFKMGLSPGVIIGFGFPISSNTQSTLTQKNFVLGASLSPYSSYKKYVQLELYFSNFQESAQSGSITLSQDTAIGNTKYKITNRTFASSGKVTTINLVPVSLRYAFNTWVGAGAGILMAVDLNNTQTRNINYTLTGQNGAADVKVTALDDSFSKSFTNLKASAFADVVVGHVRVGPAIGLRYFYDPQSGVSRLTTYATWKF
jgi:hypothetical protein